MTEKIAVLGAGSWGSILAGVLDENKNEVWLWTNKESQAKELNENHTNEHYIPGHKYSETIKATTNLKEAVDGASAVLFVVPTKVIRLVAQQLVEVLKELGQKPLIIHASKGLELGSHKRISEVIEEEIPSEYRKDVVVLSGPSHAEEVAFDIPTTVLTSSKNMKVAEEVQDLFMTKTFRVYTNDDLVGVEIGGAVKNIIALAAGVCDGLGYGDNTKAALMTRGMAEIVRIGTKLGGRVETFLGLTGMGDLIVTCTSMHSRNRRAGYLIGTGKTREEAVEEVGMIVEGIKACHAFYDLKEKLDVEMPITDALYKVLFEGKDAKEMVSELLQRDKKAENY